MPVRIAGPIDVRLLPAPSVSLGDIEVGEARDGGKLRARELALELRLGALLRGQWRVAEMRLVGPEIRLGIDAGGRIDWPTPAVAFDPDSLAIEGISVEDGRAI